MSSRSQVIIELLGQNQASREIQKVTADLTALQRASTGDAGSFAMPRATGLDDLFGRLDAAKTGVAALEAKTMAAGASVGLSAGMWLTVAGGAATAAAAIGNAAIELGNAGQTALQTENKFKAFSGGANEAAANLTAMQRATEGGISAQQAMATASMLMSMGLAKNGEDAGRITRIATMLGPAWRDAATNLNDFTMLLANQSIRRLDQFGLSVEGVRTKQAELMAADASLSKEQAFTNAVMEIGSQKLALVEEAGVKAATGAQKLEAAWADMRTEVGKELAPGVSKVEEFLAGAIRGVTDTFTRGNAYQDDPLAALRADMTKVRDAEVGNLSRLMGSPLGMNESANSRALDIEASAAAIRKLNAEIERLGNFSNIDALVEGTRQLPDTLAGAELAAQGVDVAFQNGNDDLSTMGGRIIDNTVWLTEFKDIAYQVADAFGKPLMWTIGGMGGKTPAELVDLMIRTPALPQALGPDFGITGNEGLYPGMAPGQADINREILDDWNRGVREREVADKQAAEKTASEWKAAAKAVESEWKSALGAVPGLLGTSQVTAADMELSKAGLYQDKADEYLRRLRDEVQQNKDIYPNVSIQDAAARIGVSQTADPKAILTLFEQQWQSGQLFANPANLDLINQAAVQRSLADQAAAKQGQANIMGMFGIPADVAAGRMNAAGVMTGTGLGAVPAEAMPQLDWSKAVDTKAMTESMLSGLKDDIALKNEQFMLVGKDTFSAVGAGFIRQAKDSGLLLAAVREMVLSLNPVMAGASAGGFTP